LDADGHSRDSNPLDEDLSGIKWYGDYNREVVPRWHATPYLTSISSFTLKVLIQGLDEKLDTTQLLAMYGRTWWSYRSFNKRHFLQLSLL